MTETLASLWQALTSGLPLLLWHLALTLGLLLAGISLYTKLTPFREYELIRQGTLAAGLTLGAAWIALAIPLAVTLATSQFWLDILLWGMVAVAIQLLTFGVCVLVARDLPAAIAADNRAAALHLAGVQLAVALLNAGAMAG
ncbi:DUF350 domain-containing protein [Caldichromatium japonicum]|uniref:DUF350 domain-containing protein n=1 Tax=Caldichromatium japonicum TaxID=2699430 RepID=A0A6G7VFM6_9GAMM|nr:DUF350 domain-containing protein [Caldichromatium japonicum]QIK38883.1 DUF350 domain-containing protein [Caldichromatium japonicum]